MEVAQFIYNNQQVDFISNGDSNLMVNATQMAKIFEKRIDHFLRSDHANAFINALEFTPFGGNSVGLKREEIIQTKGQSGTWMHRILALKFAAWLDPNFEVWVFFTIDQIILGHYKDVKEATIEKIQAQNELQRKKADLIQRNPELAEIFELELRITAADRKRLNALKASTAQLRLELFADAN